MTIRELLRDAVCDVPRHEASILLASVLKKDRAWLLVHDDLRLTAHQYHRFEALAHRRKKHEPIAYLINEKEFYGRPFSVSHNVLIPRPETELLIDRALTVMTDGSVTWDVGTGSGAIAVTIAAERADATVLATDVSGRALTAARWNAKRHHVGRRVNILKSNLLEPVAYRKLKRWTQTHRQLVIAANLPYLPASDKKKLMPDVVKYEPASALFSGPDGLTLIRRFLGQLSRHLPEWGYEKTTVLVEFDPPQAIILKRLAKKLFPAAMITIHRDLAGRNRLMEIST